MKTIMLFFVAAGLAACDLEPVENKHTFDQCLRVELFKVCMGLLPPAPTGSHYSDWDEVVDSCESAAMYQSRRLTPQVKKECR